MPPYQTSGTGNLTLNPAAPTVLQQGDDFYPFGVVNPAPGQQSKPNDSNVQFEAVTVGERSIACQLNYGPARSPGAVIVQVFANANPGAAEIDIQDAGVDADGAYATPTGSAAYKLTAWTQLGASANYMAYAEINPEAGRFVTLKVIANPNAVQFWGKLSVL